LTRSRRGSNAIEHGNRQVKLVAELQERFNSLTSREREVFALVVTGRPNKQIAHQLELSEMTIKVHRSQALRKMRAKSLVDLVRMADKLGVSTESPKRSNLCRVLAIGISGDLPTACFRAAQGLVCAPCFLFRCSDEQGKRELAQLRRDLSDNLDASTQTRRETYGYYWTSAGRPFAPNLQFMRPTADDEMGSRKERPHLIRWTFLHRRHCRERGRC